MEFLSPVDMLGKFGEMKPLSIVALCALVLLAMAMFFFTNRHKWTTRMLVFASMSIAIGFILSYVFLFKAPQGGSVTLVSMLPIMFFAYVFGPIPGIIAGLAFGLLQAVQEFYVVHPLSFVLDYILPFMAYGLAGLFRKNFFAGLALGAIVRYFFHFLSGVIFYGSYAPEGMPVILYSAVYNSFVLFELGLCLLVYSVPVARKTLQRIKNQWAPTPST